MSDKTIIANLGAVRQEFHDMLESLQLVKGKDYVMCVHQLLHCLQVQDITGLVMRMSKDSGVPEELLGALGEAMAQSLSQMVNAYVEVMKIDEARIEELIADAEMVKNSTNSLFKSAVTAGSHGIAMGG